MDVSIIYVNWNCEEEILASLQSVREKAHAFQYEVIVVDNASAQKLARLQLDPGILLIESARNGGFGAGCNLGARHASGRYLLFLNPDTRFLNNVVTELATFLDSHPLAGVAGPMVVDAHDTVSFNAGRSLPTLFNEFLQHSGLAFRFPQWPWASEPYLTGWDHRSTRQVGSVVGACLMVRTDLFRSLDGFDEAFFLYAEELDLCCRLRKDGREVWYVHTGRVMHKEQQSTMQMFGSLGRIILQNMRSHHYYFRKHRGEATAFFWRHMIAGLYLSRYLLSRNRLHLEYFKWAITA